MRFKCFGFQPTFSSPWHSSSKLDTAHLAYRNVLCVLCILIMLAIASCKPSVPKQAADVGHNAVVTPSDYDGATLPPNIAPIGFRIAEDGDDFITHVYSKANPDGITVKGRDVMFPEDEWHSLLNESKGRKIHIDIYVRKNGVWQRFSPITADIATDPIDPYITYRIIEPGYEGYGEITLRERNLTSFAERVFYNNMILSDNKQQQCANCHIPANYERGGRSQMHVRQAFGGTVIIDGENIRKVNLKTDSTLSAGVYAQWHPNGNLIAYSVNYTGQAFHTRDVQKIEVVDYASNLILYDVRTNKVYSIGRAKDEYDTFPAWSPDGKTLFYASTHFEQHSKYIEDDINHGGFLQLHYNIYSRRFDIGKMRFGERKHVVDAASQGMSAAFPRISPDGRYLLYSLAPYGQFHVWHKAADLWILDLSNGHSRPLTAANSKSADSYHTWSSNGRWIMFTSRRGDDNYTRIYFSYFDRHGRAHKPFLLPQKDSDYYLKLFKSYNVPEFMVQPLKINAVKLSDAIIPDAVQATYGGSLLDKN